MPFEEAADYRFNPFDLTKVWPKSDYPPITVGRLTLDRNPANFFAEVEQATFKPANLVPGTGLSPDKMLMARIFSYHDTHLHRVGVNHEQLPINAPKAPVSSYNKDGHMAYHHAGDQPVYAPNSKGGPAAAGPEMGADLGWGVEAGELARYAYEKHAEDDDFVQPRTLINEVMDDGDRETLVEGIVGHASAPEVTAPMKERVVAYWASVDQDIAARVASGLGTSDGHGAGPGPASPEATELLASRANRA
jgi:catalase